MSSEKINVSLSADLARDLNVKRGQAGPQELLASPDAVSVIALTDHAAILFGNERSVARMPKDWPQTSAPTTAGLITRPAARETEAGH